MKILLINKFLYPRGGDAICTLETGSLLSEKGHDVVFWGMKHPGNQNFMYEKYFISNIDYNKDLGVFQKLKNSLKILYSLEAKAKISSLLKEWKPDIVHLNNFVHQISPSILDVFKRFNIPTVMTMHDYKLVCPAYTMLSKGSLCDKCKSGKYYHCFLNKCTKHSTMKSLINTIEMYFHHKILKIFNKIDIFISPSKFLMNKVKEMGFNHDIVYLPNFIDLRKYEPFCEAEDKSIVYFGRLSKEKGLITLIDAVDGIDVDLRIIGEGSEKEFLLDKLKSEGITNVNFVGYKKSNELLNEVKKTLFVVMPSECYENNPRVCLEAFALGKPVIGARIGGIPELIQGKQTGLTFEAGCVEDLREKIKYLLVNQDKIIEMGKNARKFVEENFNSEKHYQDLMKIYQKAIKECE